MFASRGAWAEVRQLADFVIKEFYPEVHLTPHSLRLTPHSSPLFPQPTRLRGAMEGRGAVVEMKRGDESS